MAALRAGRAPGAYPDGALFVRRPGEGAGEDISRERIRQIERCAGRRLRTARRRVDIAHLQAGSEADSKAINPLLPDVLHGQVTCVRADGRRPTDAAPAA